MTLLQLAKEQFGTVLVNGTEYFEIDETSFEYLENDFRKMVIAEFKENCEVAEFNDEFSNFNSSFSLCMETCIPPIDNEGK